VACTTLAIAKLNESGQKTRLCLLKRSALLPNKVATRDSTPEMLSHAKALPARCETEQHPDGLALSVAERSPFFLFARMIVEMAFPIARKYKFDANVRRCSQLRSEYSDIEFRLIETLQPHFNKQS